MRLRNKLSGFFDSNRLETFKKRPKNRETCGGGQNCVDFHISRKFNSGSVYASALYMYTEKIYFLTTAKVKICISLMAIDRLEKSSEKFDSGPIYCNSHNEICKIFFTRLENWRVFNRIFRALLKLVINIKKPMIGF